VRPGQVRPALGSSYGDCCRAVRLPFTSVVRLFYRDGLLVSSHAGGAERADAGERRLAMRRLHERGVDVSMGVWPVVQRYEQWGLPVQMRSSGDHWS
jgi:hypothetical protein